MNEKKCYRMNCAMASGSCFKLADGAFCQHSDDLPKRRATDKLNDKSQDENIAAIISVNNAAVILSDSDPIDREAINSIKNRMKAKLPVDSQILSFAGYFAENSASSLNEVLIEEEDYINIQALSNDSNITSQTIDITLNALFKKNSRVRHHSKRVGEICKAIAAEMNLTKDEVHQIGLAGLMHDIGKIAISEEILEKPGLLNYAEYETIKKHSEIGYKILRSIDGFSIIADCILEHHERWDGKGYPSGIRGDAISLQARIIAVADAFDAMTTDRPYRETVRMEEAVAEIMAKAGTQFDPEVAEVFVSMVLQRA